MKNLHFLCCALFLLAQGCTISDDGILIQEPTIQLAPCPNPLSDDEVDIIRNKIDSEAFADEKMREARYLSRDRCYKAYQVVWIMEAFTFESDKLEIAKFLYTKTEDQFNYDIVVDALTYASDRDDLRNYIDSI